MLLIQFVALQLWRQQAIRDELRKGHAHLRVMGELAGSNNDKQHLSAAMARLRGEDDTVLCLAMGPGQGGDVVFSAGCGIFVDEITRALSEVAASGNRITRTLSGKPGSNDALSRSVLLAHTAAPGSRTCVAMVLTLGPLDKTITESSKIIFAYVVANAIILASIGLFRMLQLVVRPVEHLVEQADSYSLRHDFLPFPDRNDNEFSRLSASLNRMIAQVEEDREQLLQKVEALRQANEELAKNRREMVRAEKMASIGRLAAGLAHEIGNPLGVVRGYLGLLGEGGLKDGDRKEFAHRSDQELIRVSGLIRQLLDFARPAGGQIVPLRLRELLAGSIELFRGGMRRVLPEFSLTPGTGNDLVLADPDGLRQVFVNCFLNAVDALEAMPDGCITVRCDSPQPGEVPESILVIIADNGPGIPQEHLECVFDPFFTTKEPGRGTGLGLAVSSALIEKWGGSMWAENRLDGGAAIHIRLPLVASA